MVPLIVRVYVEGEDDVITDVPVTPQTTCRDVIECCRDPGDELCTLVETWRGCERTLGEDERPLEILQEWGNHQDQVKLVLRYTVLNPADINGSDGSLTHSDASDGGSRIARNGMKEPGPLGDSLGGAVELSVSELQAMACRQQQQIEAQRQLLAAKEQRLRFLKQQDARSHHVAAEHERLRRLRDRVDAQESKLRKLRALRGQVDHNKLNNASLTSDLDSIRALFNEKEKELSLAVAKVEELTRQLEELRRGRGGGAKDPQTPSPAALELDKLRRELLYRNKLNEQQSARLSQQREALSQKQEEMTSIDRRISELQDRLHRKRLLNQQLESQISNSKNQQQPAPLRTSASSSTIQHQQQQQYQPVNIGKNKPIRPLTSGNVAAVEPYHHVPSTNVNQVDRQQKPSQPPNVNQNYMKSQSDRIIQERNTTQDDFHAKLAANNSGTSHNSNSKLKEKDESFLPEFAGSKSDPKYQTLPYNTKFTVNYVSSAKLNSGPEKREGNAIDDRRNNDNEIAKNNINNNLNNNAQQHLMTVHSIPLSSVNKGLATGLHNQPEQSSYQQSTNGKIGPTQARSFGMPHAPYTVPSLQPGVSRGQPVGGPTISAPATSHSISTGHQKPVSSVAPTSVQHQKPSPIYQTSSTKIHPVQPQTLSSTPQFTSTPVGTPETQDNRSGKPALPPKPALPVKPTPPPPPRQTQHVPPADSVADLNSRFLELQKQSTPDEDNPPCPPPPPPPTSEPPLEDINSNSNTPANNLPHRSTGVGGNPDGLPIIRARPLNLKKHHPSENPKLKSSVFSNNSASGKSWTNHHVNNNNNVNNTTSGNVHVSINRRIEMPPAFLFPETEAPPADLLGSGESQQPPPPLPSTEEVDRVEPSSVENLHSEDNRVVETGKSEETKSDAVVNQEQNSSGEVAVQSAVTRRRKGNLKGSGQTGKSITRRVSFDPLALLLDASLEGELELVKCTAGRVADPSAANDEGITALHNAICAGHLDIVRFLVEFGCDVNAQDSDGWTPLHCAASCNNLAMVKFLVEHGACIFATTLSDHETAAEKCEEDEEGFDGCSEYLYSIQEKLGILNSGVVFAVYDYEAHNPDELSFHEGDQLIVLRKGDEWEREWWWSRLNDQEGYVPRNLLGLYARVHPSKKTDQS